MISLLDFTFIFVNYFNLTALSTDFWGSMSIILLSNSMKSRTIGVVFMMSAFLKPVEAELRTTCRLIPRASDSNSTEEMEFICESLCPDSCVVTVTPRLWATLGGLLAGGFTALFSLLGFRAVDFKLFRIPSTGVAVVLKSDLSLQFVPHGWFRFWTTVECIGHQPGPPIITPDFPVESNKWFYLWFLNPWWTVLAVMWYFKPKQYECCIASGSDIHVLTTMRSSARFVVVASVLECDVDPEFGEKIVKTERSLTFWITPKDGTVKFFDDIGMFVMGETDYRAVFKVSSN
jgi:hypothetical protein